MRSSLTKTFLGTALAASLVIAMAPQSHAGALSTNGLIDQEQILNYFNGGVGGNGSGPGPNLGVTFGGNAVNLISVLNGGTGDFQGVPQRGPNAVVFASFNHSSDIMNVAGGFANGFSFLYSSLIGGEVDIWSGLNATGTLLASITLGANFQDHCDAGATTDFCSWDSAGASFSGTAESVDFTPDEDLTAFADLTIGSAIPAPEPGMLALFATGLAALGFYRRQNRA